MNAPSVLLRTALVPVVLAACSLTGPQPDGISFVLNGTAHSSTYVNALISGAALTVGTDDYYAFGALEMHLHEFFGASQTYPILRFDSIGTATVRGLDGRVYDTWEYGGYGHVEITENECHRSTGVDWVTGATVTATFCTMTGTFAFIAKSADGDSVVVTDGRFHTLARRY